MAISKIEELKNIAFLKKIIKEKCENEKIDIPNYCIQNLFGKDGFTNYKTNSITFNKQMICHEGIYEFLTRKELKNLIESVVVHELTHIKQYKKIDESKNIGNKNEIIIKKTNYNFNVLSLYIKGDYNDFLSSVYVLQPCEYEAFSNAIESLKNNNSSLSNRINTINNAINFIKEKFGVDDPVKEIENALLNLYDNGQRECDKLVQDLVVRCAICSYEDKEDYGLDKVSFLLGESYEDWVGKQRREKENNYIEKKLTKFKNFFSYVNK